MVNNNKYLIFLFNSKKIEILLQEFYYVLKMHNKSELSVRARKQIFNKKNSSKKDIKQNQKFYLKKNDPIKFQKMANCRRGGVSRWRD